MNGIGISANTYDLNGAFYLSGRELDPEKTRTNTNRERRASRTATLDGGVSIYDTGYAAGDRTMGIHIKDPSPEIIAAMNYLIETYSLLTVTTDEAAFTAIPAKFSVAEDGLATLTLLVTEQIS